MFDVSSKKGVDRKEKYSTLEQQTCVNYRSKRTVIDDQNCSETSVTGNLPQLNDPTMISLGLWLWL
jgi:hypothetical protein